MERERFPRGSIPPSAFAAVATVAPAAVTAVPPCVAEGAATAGEATVDPVKHCDLSTTCPQCDSQMRPEHAHYRCEKCGYRDSCCF